MKKLKLKSGPLADGQQDRGAPETDPAKTGTCQNAIDLSDSSSDVDDGGGVKRTAHGPWGDYTPFDRTMTVDHRQTLPYIVWSVSCFSDQLVSCFILILLFFRRSGRNSRCGKGTDRSIPVA